MHVAVTFVLDKLIIAPGSVWEGVGQSDGGTAWQSRYNNHPLATAPASMTLTCSDGQSHTDNAGFTRVAHFTLTGCTQGACPNALGDTANYIQGGPYNSGIAMDTNGTLEYIYAKDFGAFGIRVDGQDAKAWHNRTYSNDEWYYYGGYKGITETAASPETSVTTTGSTGSVALSWTTVPNAVGYVIYRGTSAGGESVFFTTTTNSFTDTGSAGVGGWYGAVTNVVTNSLATPGTITATPSTTGGTLAAGTYYYKITAYGADGWHGSAEFTGMDMMADWLEVYGLFDAHSNNTSASRSMSALL